MTRCPSLVLVGVCSLLVLLLLLAGCKSGDGAATPPQFTPTVTRIVPHAAQAVTGARVRFMATSSSAVDRWQWNFGAGSSPATSTLADPEVMFGTAGSYVGTVVACI
ncbi:MAG: hypothetical protein ABI743_14485, partial [bacterium]